jgi:hypothetical protein
VVKLSDTTKVLLKGIAVFSALGMVLGAVVVLFIEIFPNAEILNYVVGVAIGAVAAAIKVVLLESALDRALARGSQTAAMFMVGGYLLRFIVTGGALIASVLLFEFFGLIGSFVGTMSLMASAYNINRLERKSKQKSTRKE